MIDENINGTPQLGVVQRQTCENCKDRAVLKCIAANDRWSLFLDDILASLVERMVNIGSGSAGAVYLYDSSTNRLTAKANCFIENALEDIQPDREKGFLGLLVQKQGSQLLYEPDNDYQIKEFYLKSRVVKAVAGIPIRIRDKIMGIVLIDYPDANVFSLADARRLEVLADHASIAIENAKLYEESRRREEELEKANKELAALDRMKSEFLSLVSHELRTPLTSIIGYVDLVLRGVDGDLSDKQRKYLSSARFSSRELLCLINNLIDFTGLEAGQVRLSPWPVQVEPMMRRIEHFAKVSSDSKGITVLVDIPDAMPPVKADEAKLQHALENIVSNAVKFSNEDSKIVLSASYSEIANEVAFCVTDFGIGIPLDKLERIWDRFYQVDSSSTRQYGGLGLGLAIAKRLAELMGGRILAESGGTKKGSSFTIVMPVSGEMPR